MSWFFFYRIRSKERFGNTANETTIFLMILKRDSMYFSAILWQSKNNVSIKEVDMAFWAMLDINYVAFNV